jgi:low temperature requirement protein LtrA
MTDGTPEVPGVGRRDDASGVPRVGGRDDGPGAPRVGPGDNTEGGGATANEPSPAATESAADEDASVRVSTLEIFFDLVFAFTLIQLTAVLASHVSWLAVFRVLLIFGLLWWMYGAYAWLTNSRPPVHTAERIGLLAGMAGFLVVGIAVPRGFSSYGVVLGLGYLIVVAVHAFLYYRVNTNIIRVAPFNTASALLVIVAGLLRGPGGSANLAAYLLWVAALAVQLGSPLIVHPAGLFQLRPAHFLERHSALLIVAIGESVAAIGIGAAGPVSRPGGASWKLLAIALLGLVVAAALWWIVFGSGDDERAEQALTEAGRTRRPALALSAFFYGFIPLLLGLIGLAAGVLMAVMLAGTARGSAGQAAVLACGAALFLGGNAAIRRQLAIGPVRVRALAAALALVTIAIGVSAGLDVQLVVVAVILVLPLLAERPPTAGPDRAGRAERPAARPGAAG